MPPQINRSSASTAQASVALSRTQNVSSPAVRDSSIVPQNILRQVMDSAQPLQATRDQIELLRDGDLKKAKQELRTMPTPDRQVERGEINSLKKDESTQTQKLTELKDKKTKLQKELAVLYSELGGLEEKVAVKQRAIDSTTSKRERLAEESDAFSAQLRNRLETARESTKKKEQVQAEFRTGIKNSEQRVRSLSKEIQKELLQLMKPVYQQKQTDFVGKHPSALPLFSASRKDIKLLGNLLATATLAPERELLQKAASWQKNPLVLIGMFVTGVVVKKLLDFLASEALSKNERIVLASVVAIFVASFHAKSTLSKLTLKEREIHALEVERRMPEKAGNTEEVSLNRLEFTGDTTLGETKRDIIAAARSPEEKFLLYNLALAAVSPKFAKQLSEEVHKQVLTGVEKALRPTTATDVEQQETLTSSTQSSFAQNFEPNIGDFEKLMKAITQDMGKDIEKKTGRARASAQEKEEAMEYAARLEVFLDANKSEIFKGLNSLMGSMGQSILEQVENNSEVTQRIEEVVKEEAKQAILTKKIEGLETPSTSDVSKQSGDDFESLDFNKMRSDSLRKMHAGLEKTRDKHQSTLTLKQREYEEKGEVYSQTLTEIEQQEEMLIRTQRELEFEVKRVKDEKLDVKAARAEAQQDLNNKIADFEREVGELAEAEDAKFKEVIASPDFKKLITPKALERSRDRHMNKNKKQLAQDVADHHYGSNFLSPAAYIEAIVGAHNSWQTYKSNWELGDKKEPLEHIDLYSDCGKQIGEGVSGGFSHPLPATGVVYSMDTRTGQITHIHPFLPRVTEWRNEALKARGNIEELA